MSRIFHPTILIITALLMSGCITMPRSADLMVKSAKSGDLFTNKEIFEVSRSHSTVAKVLKKQANKCLSRDVSKTEPTPGNRLVSRTMVMGYTPEVSVSKKHTRVTVQEKTKSGAKDVGGPPPKGWYMMVVDAYPVSKKKTRIEVYYNTKSPFPAILAATKHWAAGTNMGCPDFLQ